MTKIIGTLEEAKRLYQTANADQRYVLESLFPELKESEDERIRKAQLDYWRSVGGKEWHGVPVQETIAWLEKHKPVEHLELKAGHWYVCHRAFCCRADHLTVKEGERFMCEKDDVVKGFVIKDAEKYFKECNAPAPYEDEQKPKWSEEDESVLQGIWDEILANKHDAKEYDWKTYDKYLDWLKSLKERYTWKPSDEQMKALKDACDEHWEPDGLHPLYSLYEQLKKLME